MFIRALEASAKKPAGEVIDAKPAAGKDEGEGLEVVRPLRPEDPSAYR